MDINIIIFVVLLFIPVYLMGIVSNNKLMTFLLAGSLIIIAMVFAGGKYIFFDVLGIGAALFLAFLEADE
jgi:hypothetical protein